MKKLTAFVLMLSCVWSLVACSDAKNKETIVPPLSSVAKMDEADVNELLAGCRSNQLMEAWGAPNTSGDNAYIWCIGDTVLTVNTNNKGIVVVCGIR